MANLIYMTLTGEKQGLISQGCGTYDSMGNKYQISHQDQIFLLALTHSTHRAQNVCHQPVSVTKLVDKSSPLLGVAIANNEKLQCNFDILRTNKTGMNREIYVSLRGKVEKNAKKDISMPSHFYIHPHHPHHPVSPDFFHISQNF